MTVAIPDAKAPGGAWRWTLASALVTLVLALVAFLLPDIEWAPTGGVVGWLLVLAGSLEFVFGWKRGRDQIGLAAIVSGLITTLAGLLFVANPLAGYFPITNLVMAWLFVRGLWMTAVAVWIRRKRLAPWLGLTGVIDVSLGFTLLSQVPVNVLVYVMFGPTPEMIAMFAFILATSFFVTAISQGAIALLEKAEARRAGP